MSVWYVRACGRGMFLCVLCVNMYVGVGIVLEVLYVCRVGVVCVYVSVGGMCVLWVWNVCVWGGECDMCVRCGMSVCVWGRVWCVYVCACVVCRYVGVGCGVSVWYVCAWRCSTCGGVVNACGGVVCV